ncbi:hypothetical protein DUNSADRAFT_18699 [Dunaliella salina]|uniref:F-box domain-containing protein n=1 Tax=Dunaliella salina TaxID=3046 RepID=A0ABQ7FZP1_DUNSA|nr:hypothetical protein DUNSADRAFT_18699 [Dunaliella salina]|eukprot:KAF5827815.1 hypothetical protein DUNSADRAFT_18699 [Dunaliella salina]
MAGKKCPAQEATRPGRRKAHVEEEPVSKQQHTEGSNFVALPNDLLMMILEASGCKAICSAARCCKRLHSIKQQLDSQACYAQGVAVHWRAADLDRAVKAATVKALRGMRGSVSFGIVLVQGHEAGLGEEVPPLRLCTDNIWPDAPFIQVNPARVLQECLPGLQGTPVIACSGVSNMKQLSGKKMQTGTGRPQVEPGLSGSDVGNMDQSEELGQEGDNEGDDESPSSREDDDSDDEGERKGNGVAMLLGYEPGCRVVAFADLSGGQDPCKLEKMHRISMSDSQPYTRPSVSLLRWAGRE